MTLTALLSEQDYIGTPLDTENKFPDMKNGCFKQGAYLPLGIIRQKPSFGFFGPEKVEKS